jgi:hypothetical protein
MNASLKIAGQAGGITAAALTIAGLLFVAGIVAGAI